MEILKRTLSALLAMVLVMGMLPAPAFAAEEDAQETAPAETAVLETVPPVITAETQAPETTAAAETAPDTAEETEPEIYALDPVTVSYVNPFHEDGSALAEIPALMTLSDEEPEYYTDVDDMAAILRAGMEARQEVVSFGYQMSVEDYSGDVFNTTLNAVFETAMEHTGVPTQGDYLKWQYQRIQASASGWGDAEYLYYTVTCTVSYYTTAQQEAQVDAAVERLLAELNPTGSDYDKLRTVYDYMTANIVYDYDNLNDSTYMLKHSAYAALINGTSVCQGYALLLYRLALELGIDCRVITGIGNGEGHAWNIVKLDGKYYNADATWDAPRAQAGAEYDYFLRTDGNFSGHTRDGSYSTSAFYGTYPMGTADYEPGSAPGPHVHTYTETVTAPTCTEQGYTTYTCGCGDSYVGNYVNQLGHSFGAWTVTTQPTCTAAGAERRDCANCGHAETREIAANGHTEVVDRAVNATCTAAGLTEGKHCSVCGTILTAQQEVAALGHSWDNGVVTKEPTGEAEGERLYTCGTCGGTRSESIPKLNHIHTYTETVTPPTCEEQGCTTYTCECGDSYVGNYVNPLGHAYDAGTVTTAPGCETEGVKTFTCVNDASHTYTEAIPATGHGFRGWYIEKVATLEEAGEARRDCANCGYYESRVIEKLTEEGTPAVIVAEGASVREEPSAQGKIIGSYKYGTIVTTYETIDGWIRTGEGWVMAQYVQTEDIYMSHEERTLREKLENGETEITVSADIVLTEDLYIPEDVFVDVDGGSLTVPAGVTLDVGGWLTVYDGALTVEEDGILNISNGSWAVVDIWGGSLDVTGADLSGVPVNAIRVLLNSTSSVQGIANTKLYGDYLVTGTEDVNAALAAASRYGFMQLDPAASFTLANSITIQEGVLWNMYFSAYEIVVPSGVTVINNSDIWVQNGNLLVFEEGSRLINNGYLYVDEYSELLMFGNYENNGGFDGYITYSTMSQSDLEDFLDQNIGYGWVHSTETTLERNLTIAIPFGLYRYGKLIVPDGVTLTLNEICYLYEGSQILVEDGGKLIVNADLENDGTVIIQEGGTLEVNAAWAGNAPIELGKDHVHSYTETVTAPTCTEQGYTTFTCECGASYVGNYLAPAGHSYADWYETKAATQETEGEERRNCTSCDAYETRVIEKLTEPGDVKIFSVSGDLNASAPTREEITRKFYAITEVTQVFAEKPSVTAPYATGKLSDSLLQNGLTTLNYFRFVTRLPQVQMSDALNENGQYGAVVMAANDEMSHYPAKPADMDVYFYNEAYQATTTSNLSYNYGYSAEASLQVGLLGCLWDEDPSNIAALGHRRWLLNPKLLNVGFGYAQSESGNNYSLTKVFDTNGYADYDFVAFPASGNFPTNLFDGDIPWSVSLNPGKFAIPSLDQITVRLTRQSDGKTWTLDSTTGQPTTNTKACLGINTRSYGISNCIIFSPGSANLRSYSGVFTVEISGLKTRDGSEAKLLYEVDFFDVGEDEESHTCVYSTVVTAPTCTEQGYTTYTCGICGDSHVDNYVAATGHAYDGGIVTTQPGCETEGVRTYTCANDTSHTYTEPIPAIGHAYDGGIVTTQPGCETEGVRTFTCANDTSHTYTEPIPAIGHAYDSGIVTTQPGCETEGVRTYTCANDASHTYTEPIPATGHSVGAYTYDAVHHWQECSACGEKLYLSEHTGEKCTVCGYENAVEDVHQFQFGDANHDGRINAKDATLVLQKSVGTIREGQTFCERCADVTGDGKFNAKDSTMILRKSSGLLTTFPVEG